jgi:hypothetical protein
VRASIFGGASNHLGGDSIARERFEMFRATGRNLATLDAVATIAGSGVDGERHSHGAWTLPPGFRFSPALQYGSLEAI